MILVGCGDAGSRYADSLAAKGVLTAICDVDESKAEVAKKWNCDFFASADEALGKGDTMVLATPTGFHAEHAIKALQAGMDVIIAAPFCLTVAAVWQMIETQKFCRRQLFIVSEHSYAPFENAGRNNSSFELEVFAPTVPPKDWQTQTFPGGTIFHNHAYPAIALLTESFGVIESVKKQDGQLHIRMTKANGVIRISDSIKNGLDWQLKTAVADRTEVINNTALRSSTIASNEYSSFFPPHLSWKTALQSADTLASVEQLQKAINPSD